MKKKLKKVEVEIEDCHEEQCRTREELTHQFSELEKQLKLRLLIIDHFIPLSEVEHVKRVCVYNEDDQSWSTNSAGDTPTNDNDQYVIMHGTVESVQPSGSCSHMQS